MKPVFYILFLLPFFMFSQNTISVHVHNVPSTEGKVNVAVYDSGDTFLTFEGVVKTGTAPAQEGVVMLNIENLPPGEYAVAVFHDQNGNDILDTNWLGIPKEKVAFSKAKMKTFGPPKYKECCFKVTRDTEIDVMF
ncbi:hypothetical protein DKG77_02035 [Flagellimonas aquimarina]|uniref:DUF2141 domain-containing protein n=1 Tax=Flagellimonas aquimarina TaxID=2201895 RepID=A0A316L0J6_9FLAO|nr:DUF2141 domain-containing protein [Allomuricauda koreensis]PWL39634.1 hypothetical protein DKG77_02035 [Allomuricauda koreensis]